MSDYAIRLIPDISPDDVQEIPLHSHSTENIITNIAQSTMHWVFYDYTYSGILICDTPQKVTDFQLYINDDIPIKSDFSPTDGSFHIIDATSDSKRPFLSCYGFVQLVLSFSDDQGEHIFESDYIQVMIRKGMQNESTSRMIDYIYQNDDSLLYGSSVFPKHPSGLKNGEPKTLETKILLLGQILQIYEKNYRYFCINSRYTVKQHEHIDRFEKLQYISSKTIQYIIQHPEEMRKASSGGIKINRQYYQPNKTLITTEVPSYDIYENQIILGFIYTLVLEIAEMAKKIQDLIDKIAAGAREIGQYMSSSYYIYYNSVKKLEGYLNDLHEHHTRCRSLLSAYSNIFHLKPKRVASVPKPTAIFLAIPQYRYIFDCTVKWFNLGIYDLQEERFMLSFMRISDIYEVYTLAKLIAFFKDSGLELVNTERKRYIFKGSHLYNNTVCNNVFTLKGNHTTVTLYYQPVIYDSDRRKDTGIGLYRNTTISFPQALDLDSKKESDDRKKKGNFYYAPDFLIKYEYDDVADSKYIIADAKFSPINHVKKYYVASLAYKYLFSISPLENTASIAGLTIIHGRSDEIKDCVLDIYDKSHTPGTIFPHADILTLTENDVDNVKLHFQLLHSIFGEYLR